MAALTETISDLHNAEEHGSNRLFLAVYHELRSLAVSRLARERPGQTLQATALVHEVYMRLLGSDQGSWDNRAHFFAAAAEAMRRILVESARRRACAKHGGARKRIKLTDGDVAVTPASVDLLELDELLDRFAEEDAVKAELVKLRFYVGLSVEDSSKILGISRATAARYWRYARAWLYDAMGGATA